MDRPAKAVAVPSAEPRVAADILNRLVADRVLDLPLPAHGKTGERFSALAALAELDLTVARLAEAHCDAIAILTELGATSTDGFACGRWAVWAAEPPHARLVARVDDDGRWSLQGRKAWCSGVRGSSHALVTATADDGPRLFAVGLSDVGVHPVDDPWPATALSGTDTRSVDFHDVVASPIGGARAYLDRPGFWHGAVGVAAVWFGGTVGVARAMERAMEHNDFDDLRNAHLGAVDAALWAARSSLSAAAQAWDADPFDQSNHSAVIALCTRAVVEQAVVTVIDRVGRALGPTPLALDGAHARRVADLTLYVRQSHADHDLADLGRRLGAGGVSW